MLYTIAMILLVLWILGFSFHFFGEFIHVLIVLAIASVLIRVIQGRKPL
ncbi:MAG: lmo0937 family membrane protein [Vampirovibrionales bacterium]|jgi:asparagine N-glycosylation enzyme membrane subunit Stt3